MWWRDIKPNCDRSLFCVGRIHQEEEKIELSPIFLSKVTLYFYTKLSTRKILHQVTNTLYVFIDRIIPNQKYELVENKNTK